MNSKMTRDLERTRSRVARNANIALRAERVIARRRFAMLRTQTGLLTFAGLVAGIGVIMLNVGAFFWIASFQGNAAAGVIVAIVNFVLAVLLALFAARVNVDAELAPFMEVRDIAMQDIETEVGDALSEVHDLAENVRRMAKDPFSSTLSGLIGPALSILLKAMKK